MHTFLKFMTLIEYLYTKITAMLFIPTEIIAKQSRCTCYNENGLMA